MACFILDDPQVHPRDNKTSVEILPLVPNNAQMPFIDLQGSVAEQPTHVPVGLWGQSQEVNGELAVFGINGRRPAFMFQAPRCRHDKVHIGTSLLPINSRGTSYALCGGCPAKYATAPCHRSVCLAMDGVSVHQIWIKSRRPILQRVVIPRNTEHPADRGGFLQQRN